MSFGGSVSAMIASVKNNKRTRKSAIEKLDRLNEFSSSKTQLVFQKKATEEQLQQIRRDMRHNNFKRSVFSSIAILCIMITLIVILINLNNIF